MKRRRYCRILLLLTLTISGVQSLPANGLTNPGFENPVTSVPGNNFPGDVPGWTLYPFAAPCEAGHNIVRADGSSYDGGPDRAAEGSQYYDICGAAGYLRQRFTLTKESLVFFGASFSRRDATGGGGSVVVSDVSGNIRFGETPQVSIAAGESQELWRTGSATIPGLSPGTYDFVIFLDDTANVDNAFLYTASLAGGRFEVGNGTPASISEGLLDWALATAGAPIRLNGGPAPYTVPLTSTKVLARTITLNGGNTATLSGQGAVQLFRINSGLDLRLEDITLDRGFTGGSGGAIQNMGSLSLNNVRITNCVAGAHGGAIQNSGILTCFNCRFEYNRAGINGGALDTISSAILGSCVASNNSAGFRGGGFYNYLGFLSTSQCYVKWNTAGAYGGGIAVDGGTLRSTSDRIRGNRSNANGGGMSLNGDCIVRFPRFTLNSAVGSGGAADVLGLLNNLLENPVIHSNLSGGGAVSVREGATLSLPGANIMYNDIRLAEGVTAGGGGIIIENGAAIITDSWISNNTASHGAGGLEVNVDQSAALRNSVLTNNIGPVAQVLARGDITFEDCRIGPGPRVGIYVSGSDLIMTRSAVIGNGSASLPGGGISLHERATGTLTNCTISGNTAAVGGGIRLNGGFDGSWAGLTNVTLFGNSATIGGNLFVDNHMDVSMTLTNCIIAHPGSGGNCAGKAITASINSISSDNSCVLIGPGNRNGTDPLLGPLQDNGGPTPTHAPLAGSPAIDGVAGTGAPATDQRGRNRPAGAGPDIGAVETGGTGGIFLPAPSPGDYDGIDRGDDDGDGFPDTGELIAGTDPNSPSSFLRLTPTPGNPRRFEFSSRPGIYYRLYQSRDDLINHLTQWIDAGQGTITGDGSVKSITITPTPGVRRRYYVLKARFLDVGWP